MSRSRPKQMTAFTGAVYQNLINVTNRMAGQQRSLFQRSFTVHDLRDLFVPDTQRKLLTDAYKVAAPRGFVFDFYVKLALGDPPEETPMNLRFTWDAVGQPDAFLPPKDWGARENKPVLGFADDCNPALRDMFCETWSKIADTSFRWGMVRHVLERLHATQKNPAQVRYIWPCILTLFHRAGYKDLAAEYAEPNARAGETADIPPDIREYIKPSNDTVARSLLIEPDQYQKLPKLAVNYTVYPTYYHGRFHGTT